MRFAFIEAEQACKPPAGTVSQLCRALSVSRAGFYSWRGRPESARAKKDCLLGVKIVEAHVLNREKYGSPRIHNELKKQGFGISRKRVIRLMQEHGLVGRPKPSFIATTDSAHTLEIAPNLLDRNFKANAPNRRWVGDITYLKLPGSWLYLAVVIDLFSRFVVGWALGPDIDRHLVMRALEMGLKRRGNANGAMFHSDRGSQYASEDYRNALVASGIECSMSRKGNCWDNAVSESWFSTLSAELGKRFADQPSAHRQLFDYIEVFYNQKRSHSTLGYVSPAEFERNALSLSTKDVDDLMSKKFSTGFQSPPRPPSVLNSTTGGPSTSSVTSTTTTV